MMPVVRFGVFIEFIFLIFYLTLLWAIYFFVGPDPLLACACFFLYVLFGIYIYKNFFRAFLIFFPFYFSYFWVAVSCAYLEFGVYISEQESYSFATGRTLRLVTYVFIFLCVAICLFQANKNIYLRNYVPMFFLHSQFLVNFAFILMSTILFLLFCGLLIYGSPPVQGITRFQYWAQHPFPFLWKLQILLSQMTFFLGAVCAQSDNGIKFKSAVIVFSTVVLNVLYGDKFSTNMVALTNFAISFFLIKFIVFRQKPVLSHVLSICLVSIFFFSLLIYWFYANVHGIDSYDIPRYVLDRIFALQGHTWWGIDALALDKDFFYGFKQLFMTSSEYEVGGLKMLMYAIAPLDRVDWYVNNGITLTMGGIALPVFCVGYFITFFYVIFAGLCVGTLGIYIELKILKYQLIRILIASKMMWLFILAFNMGDLYLLCSLSFCIYLCLIFFDLLLTKLSF